MVLTFHNFSGGPSTTVGGPQKKTTGGLVFHDFSNYTPPSPVPSKLSPALPLLSSILTGPYISTQERAAATKNVLTSVTQKPSFGPLVLPKPIPMSKPVSVAVPKPAVVTKPMRPIVSQTHPLTLPTPKIVTPVLAPTTTVGKLAFHNFTPLVTPKPSVATTFQGRPNVTPVEQQRMASAVAPETSMTALSATKVRAPKFGEVPAAKFNEWFMSPSPNVPKNSKGQPVVPVRNLPFGDENPHLDWERTTDAGGNKVYLAPWNDPAVKNDTINKMYYSAGGILTGLVVFLATIVASSLGTRKAVSELSQHEQQLAQDLGLGQQAEQLKQSTSGYQYAEDIQTANASTRNALQQLGYIQRNVSSAMKQFSDGEIRGLVTRAGWNMTDSEINNMIAGLRASTTMPKLPTVSTDAITSFVNSTLKDSGTKIGNMTQLLLAIGEALPKSPPALANILAPILSMQHPTQAVADTVEKDATTFFQNLHSEISTGSWKQMGVPVGQPVTTQQTVAPAPVRTAIPAQATSLVFHNFNPAAEAPAISSPVATISTRQLPIAPSTTPTTQPVAATTVRPAPSVTTEPWQMTPDERQSKIAALQVQYKRELATPLMSEGNISPMQVGQMSKDQLARFQQDGQTKFVIEAQIQDLEHPELAKVRFDQNVVAKNQEQITALQSRLGVLQQFGQRKNGKMRPSYQKEIDKVQTQLDTLVAPKVVVTPAPLETSPSAAISAQETGATTPVEATAPQNAPAAVTPVAEPIMQAATITPATEVKWGKWIDAVGTRRTDGAGSGVVETIKTPITYRLGSGEVSVRAYAPTKAADKGIGGPFVPETGKSLELEGDTHTYYLTQMSEAEAVEGGNPSYRPFSVLEARSGNLIGYGDTVKNAIGNAQETINNNKEVYADRIERQVAVHGEVANPVTVTNAAPLPAGQTTSGEVAQTVTNMAPDFVTSGTGTTIPAEKNDIARITAVFDKAASAMWSGKLTPTTEGSFQKAFYDALDAAGVPKGALGWGKAITYYRDTKNAHGLENRLAKVAAIVEKYNNKVLAEQMAKGREHAQTVREQQEKILGVRQADREKLAQSEREAATRLREQQTNDRIASEIEVGKQKHIDRAVAAALAEKERNLAKTAEWLHAEKALSAKNKAEIASIVEYIENLDLRYMHAAEAKAIQEEAGAAGLELKHPFVAPGDTAFVWAMQNVGLHVVDSSVPLVEQQVLNLPELRALQAKVKAIADLSKEEKDVIKTRRQEALNKEIDDCVAELAEHITEKNIPNVRTGIYHGPEKKSNIANVLDKMHEVPVFLDIQFDRMQYLFQVIGGYRKRALYNSLYNKIYGADRATARSVNTDIALAHERLVQSGITPKTMSKQRTLPNEIVVTQRDVIFAAVYAGNTNTLFKMMESNGWTEENIRLSIESMSKEEVAWTNYMLDDMRMLYPQVSDAFAEINQGASLPDIMNYFPAIGEKGVDVTLGQPGKAIVHSAEQMTLDSLAFYGWGQGDTMAGGKPSFVKHREGGKMVLQTDPIKTYFSYKESALDYINRAPVASSMRAIVADARFKDAFLIVAGEKRYKALMEYVEAIANPQKALAPKDSAERVLRFLRWNAAAGTLSLRLSKAITAFMSYGMGIGRYGPTAMLYGTHKLMGDFHGSMTEIKQYAPLLYQRLVDPVRWEALIADAEKAWGVPTSVDAKRLANLGFAVGDTLDVASSFWAYTWSLLRQHLNDPAWTMERASYIAERDILQTHTSRLVQDRPAAYRGTELAQALVAFTGEATSQSMALMFDAKSAYHGKTPKAKFIAEWFTITMSVALFGMLADAVSRGRKKKTAKESGFWDGIWGRFILANIEIIPIAGRWITGAIRGYTTINEVITLKALNEFQQLLADMVKGNVGKAAEHLLRFVGFGLGIPVLGYDELMRWLKPDNAASSSSTAPRQTAPKATAPRQTAPRQTAP